MGPFIEPLRDQVIKQKKFANSAASHEERVLHMNTVWYPTYEALKKLSDHVTATGDITNLDEQVTKFTIFFSREENANSRTRGGGVSILLEYLRTVIKNGGTNGINPPAIKHFADTRQGAQTKYAPTEVGLDPRYDGQVSWKVPGPGCEIPDLQEDNEQQQLQLIEDPALAVAQSALAIVGPDSVSGQKLATLAAQLQVSICADQSIMLPAQKLMVFCAAFPVIPKLLWFVEIARGAGWGSTDEELVLTIRDVLQQIGKLWELSNDQIELKILENL